MIKSLKLLAAVLVFGLAACNDKPVNMAEGGLKGMEKAKAVEGQLQQRADETRKKEEEQK